MNERMNETSQRRFSHNLYCSTTKNEQVERSFSALDIEAFGRLIHDTNILHVPNHIPWKDVVTELPHLQAVQESGLIQFHPDDQEPKRIKPLVHGMLVSSLFSSILGTLSPGCVYLNQTLAFSKPVFAEDRIVARIQIERIRPWRKGGLVLQCKTTVSFVTEEDGKDEQDHSRIAITGSANVWLPSGHP